MISMIINDIDIEYNDRITIKVPCVQQRNSTVADWL